MRFTSLKPEENGSRCISILRGKEPKEHVTEGGLVNSDVAGIAVVFP